MIATPRLLKGKLQNSELLHFYIDFSILQNKAKKEYNY
jgi:hypothetical protein